MSIDFESIEDIEHQIDYASLRKFRYTELIGLGFIPVCIEDDLYNVIILSEDSQEEVRNLMESRLKHNAGYEFIIINDNDFKVLIGEVDEHLATDKQMTEITSQGLDLSLDDVYTGEQQKTVNKGNYSIKKFAITHNATPLKC